MMQVEVPNLTSKRSREIRQNFQRIKTFNPDWEKATRHGMASRVGFVNRQSEGQRCFCCLQHINKEDIPMNENTKELEFLGFGFPLYYSFVRNCIFLLLVSICSYNVISLYKAVTDNAKSCIESLTTGQDTHRFAMDQGTQKYPLHFLRHDKQTSKTKKEKPLNPLQRQSGKEQQQQEQDKEQNILQCSSYMTHLARIQYEVGIDDRLLRGVAFMIHLILLVYIRDKLTKLKEYFDERMTSPADYALVIKHLPRIEGLRAEIGRKLREEFQVRVVAQLILIPDLEHHQKLQQNKKELIEQLRQNIKAQKMGAQTEELKKKIELLDIQIEKEIIHEKMNYINDRIMADRAILIMNTEPEKMELLDKFEEKKFRDQGLGWERVRLTEAPEPKEIIWENISLSSKQKTSRTVFGWLLSLLVLLALTVIFAIISQQKSKTVEHKMHQFRHGRSHNRLFFFQALLMVFGMIFFVVVFNKLVISNLFHKFTDLECHSNTYKFQFSFCLKYCLGLFFTTALMTLIVQAFILGNYYKDDYGVIEEETIMFAVNSLFVPVFWAINPIYLYRKFLRWRHYGKQHFTQEEANEIMELPGYDVGKRYGEVLEIMWFTYLYSTLVPIGAVFSCFGLALYYWIDKYNLLRRSSIHSSVSGDLINLTLSLLDFTLLLSVAGEIIFDHQIRNGVGLSSWVFLGIAILYQFVPVQKMIKFLNHEKFKPEGTPYHIAQKQFRYTYYDSHILYSQLKEDRQHLMQELVNKMVIQNTKNLILQATKLT